MSKISPASGDTAGADSVEVVYPSGYVEYSRQPPHEASRYTSCTRPFGFGVSFTGHRSAALRAGADCAHTRSFGAGTAGINGPRTLTWLDVAEPAESVDIHPSAELLDAVATATGSSWADLEVFRQVAADDVIWATSVAFRAAVLRRGEIPAPVAASMITNVATHVAVHHLGGKKPREFSGRLDPDTLLRVGTTLRANSHRVVSLHEIADVAIMSPYHFHRSFRRTTGMTPATFAMAVRMERAHRMLMNGTSVREAAGAIGMVDTSHFRRCYRRFFGARTGITRR